MTRKRCFIVGVLLMIILGALDLFFTWKLTPDLKNETNAFVMWYGMGWVGIVGVSITFICFVAIPFYYHCLAFNYPEYTSESKSPAKIIAAYFFRNHSNVYISVGKALFNGLGFYLFWWYVINKITAIIHNTLVITGGSFSKVPFSRRMNIIDRIDNVFLIIMMILFIVGIVQNAKNSTKRIRNTNSIHFSFIVIFFLLYLSFRLFTSFAKTTHTVKLTDKIDPEIVLINIGEEDRASIGNMIMSIDSCKPTLIAIDAFFVNEKDRVQDSILINALKTVQNEIIGYGLDSEGKPLKSQSKFGALVSEEGLFVTEEVKGLSSSITPIRTIDNKVHELFSLKVVKHWKPNFKHSLKLNESIPIRFTRVLEQFKHFEGSELKTSKVCEYLKNKVVLIGYIGPSNEDKHFTPIRLVREYKANQPDTYGLVIIANEIRTILEYEKKD